MLQTGGDELEAVKTYFDTTGFERWNKIYGETEEVNKARPLRSCRARGAAAAAPGRRRAGRAGGARAPGAAA